MPTAKKADSLSREMQQREKETTEQSLIKDKGKAARKSAANGKTGDKQTATPKTTR